LLDAHDLGACLRNGTMLSFCTWWRQSLH
jgi:hypothetical protein